MRYCWLAVTGLEDSWTGFPNSRIFEWSETGGLKSLLLSCQMLPVLGSNSVKSSDTPENCMPEKAAGRLRGLKR